MRHGVERIHCSLMSYCRGAFIVAAGCTTLTSASAATPLLSLRRHITSFKGETRDFMERVNSKDITLVYFYTTWCKPCSRVTAKLEALELSGHLTLQSGTGGVTLPLSSFSSTTTTAASSSSCSQALGNDTNVHIVPVDTDESPTLGALHDIRSVPTFVTYRDGRIIGRVEGSSDRQLLQLLKELVHEEGNSRLSDGSVAPQQAETLGDSEVQKQIFIKGGKEMAVETPTTVTQAEERLGTHSRSEMQEEEKEREYMEEKPTKKKRGYWWLSAGPRVR